MSKLPKNTTTTARGDYPRVVGPDTALPRVLDFFELEGYSDPSAAWRAFTHAWNWAAPLPAAVPAEDPGARPVARPVPEGFVLSGQWHMPPGTDPGRWLVLPVTDPRRQDARAGAANAPDLFVTASRVLPRAPRSHPAVEYGGEAGRAFRLDDVQVPNGFATYSTGTPLREDDAAFVWTAVTGMAFGAARSLTDTLARPDPNAAGPTSPVGTHTQSGPSATGPAAELAAVLRDERLNLAARVHGAPLAGLADAVRAAKAQALAAQIRRASRTVHLVVAAAYERALLCAADEDRGALARLVEECSPILQYMRFAVELLPPGGQSSIPEG
ncbi:hypothetical protein ACWDYK_37720 [Streptomyces anthocyanicus]|uniref:hypothetical protein n=1 Tax=Streptomyces anthocyanicus TaxID=68174 RepID=UPI002F90C5AE